MHRKHSWFIAMVVAALFVAACGPLVTPTPRDAGGVEDSPTTAVTDQVTQEEDQPQEPTQIVGVEEPTPEPVSVAELVDEDDWRALGSPDAPLTMVEYSDFQ